MLCTISVNGARYVLPSLIISKRLDFDTKLGLNQGLERPKSLKGFALLPKKIGYSVTSEVTNEDNPVV